MKLRAPAYPLITVDPYFSVWSDSDCLNDKETVHWSSKPIPVSGTIIIDGEEFCFMGRASGKKLDQTDVSVTATGTKYIFEGSGIILTAEFTTPLLLDDPDLLSRPVSYLEIKAASADKCTHKLKIRISVSEEICLNFRGEDEVTTKTLKIGENISSVSIGSVKQPILGESGDDIRINWGYFYLSAENAEVTAEKSGAGDSAFTEVSAETELSCGGKSVLFTFAYDDIKSISYFGENIEAYWKRGGMTITEAINQAHGDYSSVKERCREFDSRLFTDSVRCGGEKYAEILELAYRQAVGDHKLCADKNGDMVFISKECFSGGAAATVDVSYPSVPLFLIYNPEFVTAMMRPIIKFARSESWKFDFSPHDAGIYPILDGQKYGMENPDDINGKMPVEECGNMLIMSAAAALSSGNTDFIRENLDLFEKWVKYLEKNGHDPEDQVCTDDFSGHVARNCNLSVKSFMGICSLGIIHRLLGNDEESRRYTEEAKAFADDWSERAANDDGSFMLAFDRRGSFSLKYNLIWDKVFETGLVRSCVINSEFASYRRRMNKYGVPLDSRALFTKSDWFSWCAALSYDKEGFMEFISRLWDSYNYSKSRVPLTDWYDTVTAVQNTWNNGKADVGFRNRTVQGGLFMRLLEYYGKVSVKKI